MTYGSLFAGAGGMDIGLERAGLRCVWQVECDPTANAVRRRHWPHIEHVRDVAGFSRLPKRVGRWLDRWERPDVICGGFPCQDVSVAGKRGGLAAGRTGLWWQMLRVITGMRPRYVVWENVPGLASSDGGRDFERVVGSLAERGYFGCVRTLDAQHFGVPQRRRRLFGVFACGHLRAERCAQILALADGVSRRAEKGGETEQEVAGTITGGARSRGGHNGRDESSLVVAFNWQAAGKQTTLGVGRRVGSLSSSTVAAVFAYGGNRTSGPRDQASCLSAKGGSGRMDFETETFLVGPAGGVRRFTPREYERLMGWPDDFTRWDDRGRELADGPRYRLCGNGVVAPVAEWIGRRLLEYG